MKSKPLRGSHSAQSLSLCPHYSRSGQVNFESCGNKTIDMEVFEIRT